MRYACSRDVLFWINTFCWLEEPRNLDAPSMIPFITWECQDHALDVFGDAMGKMDVICDKSRAMGATWMVLYAFYHRWAFRERRHFGLVSRTEEVVENPGDPDALFSKVDFIYSNQPGFLRPERERYTKRMVNNFTGSSITGYAATGDVARGGRKFAFLMDEFHSFRPGDDQRALDSTQSVCRSRYFVSTIKGATGCYYEMLKDETRIAKRVVLDWKQVPSNRAGMYSSHNGELLIADESYKFPKDYPYVLDGKVRSVWYDNECRRPGATKRSIARELDRDPGDAGTSVFDHNSLREHAERHCRKPDIMGRIVWDDVGLWHFARGMGPLSLWCELTSDSVPPAGEYVIACDISLGNGGEGSNSVAFVVDRRTRTQVAEYCSPNEDPVEFAESVYALCKWFNGAYLIWEMNGVGSLFTKRIVEMGYENVYFSKTKDRLRQKRTKKPGWHTSAGSREAILVDLNTALERNEFIVRSEFVISEARQYQFVNDRAYHAGERNNEDHTNRGVNHGDRVIGAALANLVLREHPRHAKKTTPAERVDPSLERYIQAERESQTQSFSDNDW